jgi:hypothetical protein
MVFDGDRNVLWMMEKKENILLHDSNHYAKPEP